MGVELVEGRDLRWWQAASTCAPPRAGSASTSSTGASTTSSSTRCSSGPTRCSGPPGLINAARLGNVTIANAVGNGVADDKLVYTLRARPHPLLPRRGADPAQRRHVAARGGRSTRRRSWTASTSWSSSRSTARAARACSSARRPAGKELARARKQLQADPRGWIAQPVVQLSTVPTLIEAGLEPRHVDLRPFAVNDGEANLGPARRPDPGRAAARSAGRQLSSRAAAPRTPGCSALSTSRARSARPSAVSRSRRSRRS